MDNLNSASPCNSVGYGGGGGGKAAYVKGEEPKQVIPAVLGGGLNREGLVLDSDISRSLVGRAQPLLNVIYLLEEDINKQDGDNIPLNFGVDIEGKRVAVSFNVLKDSIDVFDGERLSQLSQDEIKQITPNENLKGYRLFLSLEFNEEMQQIKFTCHTYKFDHFGDLNELFENIADPKVKLKGEIDGEKVKYILKNAYRRLDFQEIPVLLNKNGSPSKFNSYFTFERIPSKEKNGNSAKLILTYIKTKQPEDKHPDTVGYLTPKDTGYWSADDDENH